MHCAAFNGHAAAVQLLLAAAPHTAQCTSYAGLTPLRCAAADICCIVNDQQQNCTPELHSYGYTPSACHCPGTSEMLS